ncbi:MAG TPA: ABC transporter permease [Gemmatimonadaceae bacterium]
MRRFYQALLHLYPSSFRMEYGDDMWAAFEQQHRPGGVGAAIAAVADVIPNAVAAHWRILMQDVRFTVRSLRRMPGFAITAILVVALGVGANTAAFSLADFVLIRPLPFREPDRLVKLNGNNDISPALYRDLKTLSTSYREMGAWNYMSANLVGEGEPQRVDGIRVTAEMLPMLGVRPLLGRVFTPDDDQPGAMPSIVLSYGLWQSVFGGDRDVVGRTVSLDGLTHTILGVMPPTFGFPGRNVRFWKAFQLAPANFEDRGDNWIFVLGRLRDGVTMDQARRERDMVVAQIKQQHPEDGEWGLPPLYRLQDEISGQSRLLLQSLAGAALCILLLACANLANLLLARAVGRERELALRAALGAGRERLVRQMITESALLAVAGGAVGVLVAMVALPALVQLVPPTLPRPSDPSVDARVLAFGAVLTAITGIGFGILPALRAGRVSAADGLRETARSGGGRRQRARFALVTLQVMASVVLLVSTGLLVRAMWRLQSVDPGFRTDDVLTLRTQLPLPRYDSVARRDQFFSAVVRGVTALPGVSSAAYVTGLPIDMPGRVWDVQIIGRPEPPPGSMVIAHSRFVTPGFFATLGIPLRAGRDFDERDTQSSVPVAVVSESFVERFIPGEDPLGVRFNFGPAGERTIVGVVGDVRVRGLQQESLPQVYLGHQQVADGAIIGYIPRDLVIRSSVPPASLIPAVRRVVSAADPEQPISNVRTMAEIVASETESRAVQLRVLGTLAIIALVLVLVGIHGLLAYTVSQRLGEFGVRLALGARPERIGRMVLREGAVLVVAGVLPGLVIAYWAGRAMQALLAGVPPTDPATLVLAVGACSVVALSGSVLSALRAMRVDPARVLRTD